LGNPSRFAANIASHVPTIESTGALKAATKFVAAFSCWEVWLKLRQMNSFSWREPSAARAGGPVLLVSCLLVVVGLIFHPPPSHGFDEKPSLLHNTPWWGPIHIAIAAGFVGCVLGSLLMLCAGGVLTKRPSGAFGWAAMCVGMIFFSGVALVNGWVMHFLTDQNAPLKEPLVYDAFNRLLIGFGWLGNPLFLAGLTSIAALEVRYRTIEQPRGLAWFGLVFALLSWGRGVGSATGLYFLEPLIYANVPAFLWLGLYGARIFHLADETALQGE